MSVDVRRIQESLQNKHANEGVAGLQMMTHLKGFFEDENRNEDEKKGIDETA